MQFFWFNLKMTMPNSTPCVESKQNKSEPTSNIIIKNSQLQCKYVCIQYIVAQIIIHIYNQPFIQFSPLWFICNYRLVFFIQVIHSCLLANSFYLTYCQFAKLQMLVKMRHHLPAPQQNNVSVYKCITMERFKLLKTTFRWYSFFENTAITMNCNRM